MNFHKAQAPQGYLRASTEKLCFTAPKTRYSTGSSCWTIYLLLQEKKLWSIKVRNGTLVPADSLRSYLASIMMEAR